MQEKLDALARRIDRLERRLRVQRGAAALAIAVGAAGALADASGAPSGPSGPLPAEVRAGRFSLVSAGGKTLAALEPGAAGGARLSLFGADDAPRIALDVAAGGTPSVVLNDASGARRIVLEAAPEALVSVEGAAGRTAVKMANDGVAPRLAVADALGRERIWVAVRLGSPVVQFLDARGSARTGLTTFNDDTGIAVVSPIDKSRPGLVLLGKEGTVLWSAP